MKKLMMTTVTAMVALGLIIQPANAFAKKEEIVNVAHRGASGYAPENTMAAFEKAVDMKSDMFELDVQLSKDGELVVIHDTSVDRTTDGSGKVKDLTLEELRSLDAGSWFDEAFTGEKIPTLGEVLDEYRGKIGILIEIKSPSLYPGIEQKVADALTERNMHKPNNNKIIVQSFDHDSVQTFHSILPSVPLGVLVYNPDHLTDQRLEAFSEYASYVNPSKSLVDRELVTRIHDYDMDVHPWTARDRESVQALKEAGVDGIITDYPDYVD
ncbi:glycerophosphodiester phosphodiesterase [Alkalihalobacillus sp. CinArs1]|uniref:glycerophosphodiester phosphodiesterase n=1 Tax=Alkalihalobacillus sp. CinArs1 TaxID=2995314 RepID=UPI0022DD3D55|nr:glycerophosphodiester phosphodiesterase family protein [Alkalihalobacillus sp. CinArs1]